MSKSRQNLIIELHGEIKRAFEKGDKVSKADIGRVLDVCIAKQGFESIFETRIYTNYGSIYCYLLELINQKEKEGKLYPIQEELLRGTREKSLYGVLIPRSQHRVDVCIYKTKDEANAQNMRKTTLIREVQLGLLSEKRYREGVASIKKRAYKVEENMGLQSIQNGVLNYLVDGKYRVEIVQI